MTLAAKQFDLIVGIDIHIILVPAVPSPIPTPIPHPYTGIVFDPMAFLPIVGTTVMVNGLPAATAGTSGKAIPPHIPIGGMFLKPPSNESEMFMGSATVLVDGEPMTFMGLPVLSCSDVGMPAPPRAKKSPPMSLMLPTSMVISIPSGAPVLVGGPPTISMMGMAMKLGMGALGKGIKKLRKLQKASGRAKALSNRIQRTARRAMDKLGVPPSARNRVHRAICTVTGHPVDVATGKMFTENVDLELPGPVRLCWERVYFTTSKYRGPLGHGWHHSYDMALAEDGPGVAVRLADGRPIVFAKPELGQESFNADERMTLLRDRQGYAMRNADGLLHRFAHVDDSGEIQRLVAVENRTGERIRLHYDARGALREIVDSSGRTITVTTDAEGRIVALSVPHPTKTTQSITWVRYVYDRAGDLVQVIDAAGQSAHYRYQNHLLVRETFRSGLNFYFEYSRDDHHARCLRTWGDGGIYDHRLKYLANETTEVTDSLGHTVTYYSQNGLVVRTEDPYGAQTMVIHDEHNRVLQEFEPSVPPTSYEYDTRGNRTKITRPDGTVVQIAYDHRDLPVRAVDPNGGWWTWDYDSQARLVERCNPLGERTRFHHEGGRLVGISRADDNHVLLGYDGFGNLHQVRTPDGEVSQWHFDRLGRPVATVDPKGNVVRRTYDVLGRVVQVEEPDGNVRTLQYDAEGNLVRAQDRLYDVAFGYQGMGRLAWRAQAGTRVEFLYDTEEQLIGVKNQHGYHYSLERDLNGLLAIERAYDGSTRRYHRDAAGRVIGLTHPNGEMTQMTYDPMDRPIVVQHPDKSLEQYSYRADGQLIEADNLGAKVTFERDALGRVVKETQGEHWVASRYDANGLRVRMESSWGLRQEIERNVMGDVDAVRAFSAGRPIPAEATESGDGAAKHQAPPGGGPMDAPFWQTKIHRDALGLEVERHLPGGLVSRWTRDRLGRPVQHDVWAGGQSHVQRQYQWNFDRRLQNITDAGIGTTNYTHDALGQLAFAQYPDGSVDLRMPDAVGNLFRSRDRSDRRYGQAGQLLEARTAQGLVRYHYDLAGNLVRKETPGGEWRYEWNSAGMMKKVVRPDGREVTFTYDALGRRVSKTFAGKTTLWVWDGHVPLHEWVEVPDGVVGESATSEDEPRTAAVDVATAWREAVLAGRPSTGPPGDAATLAQKNEIPEHVTTWIFEPESHVPMAKLVGNERLSILTDHIGTPMAMVDHWGDRVWAAVLDTFGEIRAVEGDRCACPFRFQGQYEDVETGLYYNRFRYYDPEAGTYTAFDPIGLDGGLALRAYVPDPTGWVDPFGLAKQGGCGEGGVSPSDISFSQPTISQNFSNGGTLNDTIAQLRSGEITPESIPAIRVVERNGQLITLDNRRLAAFQAAGVKEVPVQRVSLSDPAIAREFGKKFNPVNEGRNVVVTSNAAGRKDAERVLRQQGKIR